MFSLSNKNNNTMDLKNNYMYLEHTKQRQCCQLIRNIHSLFSSSINMFYFPKFKLNITFPSGVATTGFTSASPFKSPDFFKLKAIKYRVKYITTAITYCDK